MHILSSPWRISSTARRRAGRTRLGPTAWAADSDAFGAEREGFEDIGAAPEPSIDKDGNAVIDRRYHFGQAWTVARKVSVERPP